MTLKVKQLNLQTWLLFSVSFLVLGAAFPSYQLVNEVRVELLLDLPPEVEPGQVLLLDRESDIKSVSINGKPFTSVGDKWLGVVGIESGPELLVHGTLNEFISNHRHPRVTYFTHPLPVLKSAKKGNRLRIPASTWAKVNDEHALKKELERDQMLKILRQINGDFQRSCWQWPIKAHVTSQFAAPRRLPDNTRYLHSGLDLRAAKGESIKATAHGRVAYSGHMIVPGNIVVIDHGGGVYSRYMHLSQLSVRAGDVVQVGQEIGRAGATGRVEGPHLHWEILWKGNHANPQEFVKMWEPICDQESA